MALVGCTYGRFVKRCMYGRGEAILDLQQGLVGGHWVQNLALYGSDIIYRITCMFGTASI